MTNRHNISYQLQSILARRDHSIHEVRQKLAKKGFYKEDVENTIQAAINSNLLDDQRFAEAYINSILRQKPVGPRYLEYKLREKGISTEIISAALDQIYPPDLQKQLAKTAASKWRQLHPKDADNREKITRFLASRGFSIESIKTTSN